MPESSIDQLINSQHLSQSDDRMLDYTDTLNSSQSLFAIHRQFDVGDFYLKVGDSGVKKGVRDRCGQSEFIWLNASLAPKAFGLALD